jgi:hypothetical protein
MGQGNNRTWKSQLLQNRGKGEQQRALAKFTKERITPACMQTHGQETAKSKFAKFASEISFLQFFRVWNWRLPWPAQGEATSRVHVAMELTR